METVEVIKALCEKKKMTIAKLERELSFGNGTIAKSAGTMRIDRFKAIADYFGVTMEYLMTGADASDRKPTAMELTDQEEELLGIFRYLSNKEELLKYARFLKEGEKANERKALDA